MKELSIEQKAQRYDEAFKEASVAHKDEDRHLKATLERIFPELSESEDERIRDWLICYFKEVCDNVSEKEKKGVLAWLEKQQKPIFEMKTPEESLGIDSDTYSKIVDECVYGEQKPVWSKQDETLLNCCLGAINTTDYFDKDNKNEMSNWLISLKDRVQPNPTWNEEDRRMIIGLIDELDAIMNKATPNEISVYSKYTNWLKFLKDKVLIQPKQEWSEEDKEIIDYLIDYLESGLDSSYTDLDKETFIKEINWLKSLRPNLQWKPSDEQIEALDRMVNFAHFDEVENRDMVRILLNELRRLREE